MYTEGACAERWKGLMAPSQDAPLMVSATPFTISSSTRAPIPSAVAVWRSAGSCEIRSASPKQASRPAVMETALPSSPPRLASCPTRGATAEIPSVEARQAIRRTSAKAALRARIRRLRESPAASHCSVSPRSSSPRPMPMAASPDQTIIRTIAPDSHLYCS